MKNSFTLLELVVVILIMGIVLFLVVPNLSVKYKEVKFDNFSYRVLQFFKLAQDRSFKENNIFEVQIDFEFFKTYKNNILVNSISIPEEYRVNTEIERVIFYPTGLLRVYSDSEVLNLAQVKIIFNKNIKRIVFYSEAGNVFIEE